VCYSAGPKYLLDRDSQREGFTTKVLESDTSYDSDDSSSLPRESIFLANQRFGGLNMKHENSAFAAALGLVLIGVACVTLTGRSSAAKSSAQNHTNTNHSTAGTTFKNIVVLTDLKDGPSSQLYSAMQFMAGSLSVSCNYCHVSEHGPFESDAKKTKQIAREMIKMTRAINANSFSGQQVVTCNTCHQGSPHPNGVPSPWYKTAEQITEYNKSFSANTPAAAKPGNSSADALTLPTLDQVMARYRLAVGGNGLKSLRVTGTYTTAVSGNAIPVPFEADYIFPDQILLSEGAAGSQVRNIVSKDHGWRLTAQETTELPEGQIAAVRYRSQELVPVKYQTPTAPRKVTGIETIDGKSYWVVEWHSPAGTGKLFFDQGSGLLYKFRAERPSALGTTVEEKTFEDYRKVNGVKLAFLITEHYMEEQTVYTVAGAETNVTFDPATFTARAAEQK
jgi:photosynthetic reaction center cytochrome c subunit